MFYLLIKFLKIRKCFIKFICNSSFQFRAFRDSAAHTSSALLSRSRMKILCSQKNDVF